MKRKLYSIDMTLNNFMKNIKSTELKPVDNIKFSYIKKGTEKSKDKSSIIYYLEKENPKETPKETAKKKPKDYSVFIEYMRKNGYDVIDAENLKFKVQSYTDPSIKYNIWHDCEDECFKCECPSYFFSDPDFKCKHLNHFIDVYDKF